MDEIDEKLFEEHVQMSRGRANSKASLSGVAEWQESPNHPLLPVSLLQAVEPAEGAAVPVKDDDWPDDDAVVLTYSDEV